QGLGVGEVAEQVVHQVAPAQVHPLGVGVADRRGQLQRLPVGAAGARGRVALFVHALSSPKASASSTTKPSGPTRTGLHSISRIPPRRIAASSAVSTLAVATATVRRSAVSASRAASLRRR